MIEIIIIVSVFILGFTIGRVLLQKTQKIDGTLRIDHSDPDDPPYLFAELNNGAIDLGKRKYVTFKVNVKNYIS